MRKTLGRENPIVTRSRTALIGGVDELLTRRTAAEISVTDVVEAAGMSRPTFYQHFTDLGSAFAAAGLARLTTMFSQIDPSGPDELADSFADVVQRMEPDAQFYSRVQDSPGGTAFQAGTVELTAAWLRGLPALSTLPADDDALWEFLAAGVVWIITGHLAAYCRNPDGPRSHPAKDLARIIADRMHDGRITP